MNSQMTAGRLPVLDGLRAIAILVVLVFHFCMWPQGGFLGVDMFFVLSGFLITGALLRSGVNLKDFYYGRVLRILPAVAEMVLLYSAIKLAYPSKVNFFRENVLSSVFLYANWARAFRLPYPDFLGHMWSLSVEEQYYLVWPCLILVTLAVARRERAVAWLAGISMCLLWGWRMLLSANPAVTGERIYNGTDTRISSILLGCLVAVLLRDEGVLNVLRRKPRAVRVFAAIGAIAMGAGMNWFYWSSRALYTWGFIVTSLSCAAIMTALVVFPGSMAGRAMSWRPLVWIGKRSYGLYLFHFPILIWLADIMHVKTGAELAILGGVPSFCLAALSWRFVEEPLMGLRYRSVRVQAPVEEAASVHGG